MLQIPTLRRLICLVQPIFSILSSYSFFMSNRVAGSTISSSSIEVKFMSIFTLSFFGVDCNGTCSSKGVGSVSYKFKMFGVATNPISAKMVKFFFIRGFSLRNWFYKMGVYNPVDFFSSAINKTLSISTRVFSSSPNPTSSSLVNKYFGKNSLVFFGV